MRPFITSFGMICTGATYHLHDRREGVTAEFAGVFGFPCTFVEFVAASVTSVGMAGAGGAAKLSCVNAAMSTVFTIIVCHRLILSISQTKKRGIHIVRPSHRHCQTTQTKKILLSRLPEYEAATIWRNKHILWQGRASVLLIFVLFVLAILSNEPIDNMPFQLCAESKFQYKYSN